MENDKNVSIREEVVSAPSIPDAVKTAEGEKMAEAVNRGRIQIPRQTLSPGPWHTTSGACNTISTP